MYFTDKEKVSRWDEEDDLQTEIVKGKLKTGTDEGSSVQKFNGIGVGRIRLFPFLPIPFTTPIHRL